MTTQDTPAIPRLNIDHLPVSGKLYALRDCVQDVQDIHFDMDIFGRNFSDDGRLSWAKLISPHVPTADKPHCGSAACVLGSAAYRFEGLEMDSEGEAKGFYIVVDQASRLRGFAAGKKFFGITYEESDMLFSPEWHADEDDEDDEGYGDDGDDVHIRTRTREEMIDVITQLADEYAAQGQ